MRNAGVAVVVVLAGSLVGCGGGSDGGGPAVPGPQAGLSCAALAGMTFGDARVTSASFQSTSSSSAPVSYCDVRAQVGAQLLFALRLPVTWSGRYLHIGGGNYDGIIPNLDADFHGASTALARGYAVGGSNGGHIGNPATFGGPTYDASFGMNDRDARIDYVWRAIGKMDVPAKAIITAYYARPIQRSYFSGCSTGGREAIAAAIHYPDQYDGVISGAPSINSAGSAASRITINNFVQRPGYALTQADVALLEASTVAACDAADGLVDGIVSHPEACKFDPASLLCGAGGGACLSQGQVDSVRLIRGGTRLSDGTLIYAGFGIGAESKSPDGLVLHIFDGRPNLPAPANFMLVDALLQNFVYNDPAYRSSSFVLDRDYPAVLAAQLDNGMQVQPEGLQAFLEAGKKFLLWHGESDYSTSKNESVRFFQDLTRLHGADIAARGARLHVLPGVQHCGSNSVNAETFDKIAALAEWVENGRPPETHTTRLTYSAATPVITRPLCAYPMFPRYNGSGAPDRADSFTCAAP